MPLRIIAGAARGRAIAVPRGMDTRPTLDRVKESLFSILMPWLPDAQVLDLFAGSGALGLEALSRGAASAVFADNARAAQAAVQSNIIAVNMRQSARLLRMGWRQALRTLAVEGARFSLVFLDPPYQMPDADDMLESLRCSGLLMPDALVVYEHAKEKPPGGEGWRLRDRRPYGDTEISFFEMVGDEGGGTDADGTVPGQL